MSHVRNWHVSKKGFWHLIRYTKIAPWIITRRCSFFLFVIGLHSFKCKYIYISHRYIEITVVTLKMTLNNHNSIRNEFSSQNHLEKRYYTCFILYLLFFIFSLFWPWPWNRRFDLENVLEYQQIWLEIDYSVKNTSKWSIKVVAICIC